MGRRDSASNRVTTGPFKSETAPGSKLTSPEALRFDSRRAGPGKQSDQATCLDARTPPSHDWRSGYVLVCANHPRIGSRALSREISKARAAINVSQRFERQNAVERVISDSLLRSKQTAKKTSLSFHRLCLTQIRLSLNLLAKSLGNLWQRVALSDQTEPSRCSAAATISERRTTDVTILKSLQVIPAARRRPGRAIWLCLVCGISFSVLRPLDLCAQSLPLAISLAGDANQGDINPFYMNRGRLHQER